MGLWTGTAGAIAGLAAMAAAGTAAAENWAMVAGSGEYIVGVDRDSLHVNGTRRAFTTIHAYRVTYDMGAGSWIDYRISEYTADCAARTMTLMVDTGFLLNQPASVYKDILGDESSTPTAGSIGGGIFDFVCGGEGHGAFPSEESFITTTRTLLSKD